MKKSVEYRDHFERLKVSYYEAQSENEMLDLKADVREEMREVDDMRLQEFKDLQKLEMEILLYVSKEKENNDEPIYNPEAELDRMFPNRGDDDFDGESIGF